MEAGFQGPNAAPGVGPGCGHWVWLRGRSSPSPTSMESRVRGSEDLGAASPVWGGLACPPQAGVLHTAPSGLGPPGPGLMRQTPNEDPGAEGRPPGAGSRGLPVGGEAQEAGVSGPVLCR